MVGLRGASLCIEGRLGLFFGSEAGDSWLRRASLLSRMLVLAGIDRKSVV